MANLKRHWQKFWSLFLTIPLILLAGMYFWYTYQYLPLGNKTTFYWLHISLYYVPPIISCGIVPIMFLGFFLVFIITMAQDKPDLKVGLALLLLIPTLILAGGVTFFDTFASSDFKDSAKIDGHIYRMSLELRTGIAGIESQQLITLWRCDSSGLFCKIIHQEHFDTRIYRLEVDSQRHTISMKINDDKVYIHHTK